MRQWTTVILTGCLVVAFGALMASISPAEYDAAHPSIQREIKALRQDVSRLAECRK